MSVLRAQIAIPTALQGVGFDGYVNTWYFANIGTSTPAESAVDAKGWLQTFYSALAGHIASDSSDSPATFKVYDLSDAEPRSPVYDSTISISGTSGQYLPPEVALVLSYRALYRSGVPKGRCRGRVYLGPFATASNSNGRPSSALLTAVGTAAAALLTSSQASTDTVWRVHSEMEGDSSSQNVTGGWVDDEWDTQRRRSLNLTTRTQFGSGH